MAMRMLRVSLGNGADGGDEYAAEADRARANAGKKGEDGGSAASPIAVVLDLLGIGRQVAKPPKDSKGEKAPTPGGDSTSAKSGSQVSNADQFVNSALMTTGVDPLPMGVTGIQRINPFGLGFR